LNTVNEGAEVTLAARLFLARAAVTWNEWLPILQSHVHGMISQWLIAWKHSSPKCSVICVEWEGTNSTN